MIMCVHALEDKVLEIKKKQQAKIGAQPTCMYMYTTLPPIKIINQEILYLSCKIFVNANCSLTLLVDSFGRVCALAL